MSHYYLHKYEVTIEPHLEMSYNLSMPSKIIFYCHEVFADRQVVNTDSSNVRPLILRRVVKPLCATCVGCLTP